MTIGCRPQFPVYLLATLLLASPSGTLAQGYGTIICGSAGSEFRRCNVDTQGEVRFLRQISNAACVQGENWGYDVRGIWVDGGCHAEFAFGRSTTAAPAQSAAVGEKIVVCESEYRQYRYCPASTQGAVAIKRQLSPTACVEGKNWGYDVNGIWVSDNCRAEFAYGATAPPRTTPSGTSTQATLICESARGQYNYCPADTQSNVRVSQQHSKAACVLGQTWGYEKKGIWVQGGCRATFAYGSPRSGSAAVPSWLIGTFRGYNPLYDAGVQLEITADGAVAGHLRGGRISGQYQDDKLVVDGVHYTVRRESDGFRTIQDNDPGNQVIYSRVR
ncbi:MAG: DUF3011 domain-containing protein [Chromatiales bacterium]